MYVRIKAIKSESIVQRGIDVMTRETAIDKEKAGSKLDEMESIKRNGTFSRSSLASVNHC